MAKHLNSAEELGEIQKSSIDSKKYDPNIQDIDGHTSLFRLVQSGDTEGVKQLIAAGADLDIKNNEGFTALSIAAYRGYTEIVQQLIAAGADPDVISNDGVTAIYIAAQNGHAEIVQQLIAAGADLNLQSNDGVTAIYIAAQNDYAEIVQKLIAAGADLNIKFRNSFTLLDAAIYDNNLGTTKVILSNGYNNVDDAIFASASKKIQKEVDKFNDNPVKYILENNNIAARAEEALSNFLEFAEESTATRVFNIVEPSLPQFAQKAFSYFKPESIIDHIYEAAECLAAQDHSIELDLYALCGENASWYQV